MTQILVIVSLSAVALCAWAGRRRAHIVLFVYVLLSSVVRIISGYYGTTNYLGLGKEWTFLDILFAFLVIVVWPSAGEGSSARQWRRLDLAMAGIMVLVGVGFLLGGGLYGFGSGVLGYTRKFSFVPIYFVAVRLLSTRQRVTEFFASVKLFIPFFFAVHLAVAFRFLTPPISQFEYEAWLLGQDAFLRVEAVMDPWIYVAAAAIAISALIAGSAKKIPNIIVVGLSVFGVLLSQTRSYYLALGIVTLSVFVVLRNRMTALFWMTVSAAVVLAVLPQLDFDLFFRLERLQRLGVASYWEGWRGQEWGAVVGEYIRSPQLLLTGRGFGATHVVAASGFPTVNFFHSEYLKVASSLGLVGLALHMFVITRVAFGLRHNAAQRGISELAAPGRMLFMAGLGASIFVGFLWHPAFGPLVLCMAAIARNERTLVEEALVRGSGRGGEYHSAPSSEGVTGEGTPSTLPWDRNCC